MQRGKPWAKNKKISNRSINTRIPRFSLICPPRPLSIYLSMPFTDFMKINCEIMNMKSGYWTVPLNKKKCKKRKPCKSTILGWFFFLEYSFRLKGLEFFETSHNIRLSLRMQYARCRLCCLFNCLFCVWTLEWVSDFKVHYHFSLITMETL